MKRTSPSDFETLTSDQLFEEYSSPIKIPKMAESAENDKQGYWERTWHALDFDDGTLPLCFLWLSFGH